MSLFFGPLVDMEFTLIRAQRRTFKLQTSSSRASRHLIRWEGFIVFTSRGILKWRHFFFFSDTCSGAEKVQCLYLKCDSWVWRHSRKNLSAHKSSQVIINRSQLGFSMHLCPRFSTRNSCTSMLWWPASCAYIDNERNLQNLRLSFVQVQNATFNRIIVWAIVKHRLWQSLNEEHNYTEPKLKYITGRYLQLQMKKRDAPGCFSFWTALSEIFLFLSHLPPWWQADFIWLIQ